MFKIGKPFVLTKDGGSPGMPDTLTVYILSQPCLGDRKRKTIVIPAFTPTSTTASTTKYTNPDFIVEALDITNDTICAPLYRADLLVPTGIVKMIPAGISFTTDAQASAVQINHVELGFSYYRY